MSYSLAGFLTRESADVDTLQQAMRYVIAEQTNDLSPEKMRQHLVDSLGNRDTVEELLQTLERSPDAISDAALVVLSSAWQDQQQRKVVVGSVEDAKLKAPVIEVGILAIVAMYGMFLYATKGVKTKTVTYKTREDGTEEYTEQTEYWAPSAPLAMIIQLSTSSTRACSH